MLETRDPSEDLSRWLQDVARRRAPHAVPRRRYDRSVPAAKPPKQGGWNRAEPFVMLALLELAYLQYFYADVMNTILSMRSLIVFVSPS